MSSRVLAAAMFGVAGLIPALVGCESTPTGRSQFSAMQQADHPMKCQLCYDEAVIVRKASAKGTQWKSSRVIRKHMCPECKADVTTYTQDGTPMIRCPGCTPEGVPCDRCRSPRSGA